MKVMFHYPSKHGWTKEVDLPVVPREGDTVHWGENEDAYIVRLVAWYPTDDPPMAYVVLRAPGGQR